MGKMFWKVLKGTIGKLLSILGSGLKQVCYVGHLFVLSGCNKSASYKGCITLLAVLLKKKITYL